MKSFALLLFSILFYSSTFSQTGVYLFGYMDNAPGNTFEVSVIIYSNPPVTTQLTVNPDGSMTNGGGNWVSLPSSEWTHFEVIYPTCNNETNILTVNADSLPNMIDVFFQVDYCPAVNEIYGCTDPNAVNYNPEANMDDGSCQYNGNCDANEVEILVMSGQWGQEMAWTLFHNGDTIASEGGYQNNSTYVYPLCLEDGCYTFEMYDTFGDGWNGGNFSVFYNGETIAYGSLDTGNFGSFDFGLNDDSCDSTNLIYGCTDPNAINFNPQANVNDGSCEYETTCTPITLIFDGPSNGQGTWDLFETNGQYIQSGSYSGSDETYDLCLEDGCYDLFFVLNSGDPITNQVVYSIFQGDSLTDFGTFYDQTNIGQFGVNANCDSTDWIYGCTNPNAINYNPNANVDDGSCIFNEVGNDLCADATELQPGTQLISNVGAVNNENVWGECWAFGSGEGEQTSVWYSFTTPDEPASIHIEASGDGTNTLTDTQFGLFEECGGEMIYCDGNAGQGLFSAFHFECGELEENTTYILMIDGYFGDNGTCNLTYEVETGCDQVSGCTDPSAINYNPLATFEDGSCLYQDSCATNTVLIELNTALWGEEISWNLYNENTLVASSGIYQSDASYLDALCLEDGCYTLEMLDSFGDGWNGAQISISIAGQNGHLASGTLDNGEFGTLDFSINAECESIEECGEIYFEALLPGDSAMGCTTLLQAFYNGDNQSGILTWDFGDGTPPVQGNNWIGQHEFTENGSYPICVTYTTDNCSVTWCDMVVIEGCEGEVYGCTDPAAVNFNANATLDDGSCVYQDSCATNTVLIELNTALWGEEISWNLYNENTLVASSGIYQSDASYLDALCLEDGCYTLEMLDSFGDGWNGAQISISIAGQNGYLASGTLDNGEFGTLDFSINAECESIEECGEIYFEALLPGDSAMGCTTLLQAFYNGDNQSGILTWDFGDGTPPVQGNNWIGQHEFTENGSYPICVTYTTDNCSVTWCDMVVIEGCEGEVYGCTDPAAVNFNANATLDDGSCEFQNDSCETNEVLLTINTSNWGYEISWNIVQDGVEIAGDSGYDSNSSYTHVLCLEDGCYTFEMFDSFGDGWNGGSFELSVGNESILSGTLESDEYGYLDFGINAEGCEPEIYGCTDPNAINYNPNATVDDGSCEYQFECAISFTVTPDSTGAQVIWITPSFNITNAATVEWDFGDGTTSNELFPIHSYEGDGPYTLCLTAYFEEPNGGFCEITYCAVLTDEMINPPGMQSQGFSINVIDPSGTTGVNETDLISDLTVWPNPASSHVQLEFSLENSENIAIELFDITGKRVQADSFAASNGSNLYQIDVNNLTPGMYLVRLTGENSQTTTRLIKQ